MRTVVGLFQDRNRARRTMDDLERIGVHESDVSLLSKEGANGPMAAYVLDALLRMGLSWAEAQEYVDGIERGCTLETVAVADARADDALEIMRKRAVGIGVTSVPSPPVEEASSFRSENIDVELRAVDRTVDIIVEGIPYDPDVYREHHGSAYGTTGLQFHECEPAYRFGHDLRCSESDERWSVVEPIARRFWEMSHPSTWERFSGAIRHAWDRARG
jgi:hypothetical protein